MANKKIGMGIIGFGGMAQWHTKKIAEIEGLNLIGTFDIRQERQDLAIEKGLTAYESREALLADENIGLVLIATPNDVHKEIAIAAMRAGKNVVCEKPVCMNSQELEEIIAVQKETGKVFVVHQNRRWDEDFLTVKKMYDEDMLGDIFRIESRVLGSRGIPGDWRKEKAHGGGMVLDWAVHLVDQALMMIPEKVKKVYSHLTFVSGAEVDDGCYIDLTFESGLIFHVEIGTNNFINLPRWYVTGLNGSATVEWDLSGQMVKVVNFDIGEATPIVTAAGLTKTMAPRTDDSIKEVEITKVSADILDYYNNVVATINGEAEIIVKNDQVLRVFKLLEACFKSHELQQVVDFE